MGLYKNTNGSLDLISGGTLYADNPIGTILPFGGSSIPTGFLLCDGTAVSRTTYSELFAVIGTSFGSGDSVSTFNVPDLRGEFIRGAGNNSHTDQGNGGTVGEHQDATKFVPSQSTTSNLYTADLTGSNKSYIARPSPGPRFCAPSAPRPREAPGPATAAGPQPPAT